MFRNRSQENAMEQRANIKFSFKMGKSASETLETMRRVYGKRCLSRAQIFRWYARFKDGREDLEDDERPGRPISVRNEELVERVRKQIKINRCASLRMMAENFGVDKETIRKILCEDLGRKRICERFVPLNLSDDQLYDRIKYSKDIIKTSLRHPEFLDSIVTGDETWCFHYNFKSKRKYGDLTPKVKKLQPTKIKTLLITFYDSKGIIHHEFVPSGVRVTDHFYLTVLERLWKRIVRTRPEYYESGRWYLLHSNTPIHKTTNVLSFLAHRQICVLAHPPCSPDLTPCDYFLFPKLKIPLKGRQFRNVEDIQNSLTLCLEAIPKEDLRQSFLDLVERAAHCIEAGGAYVEEIK